MIYQTYDMKLKAGCYYMVSEGPGHKHTGKQPPGVVLLRERDEEDFDNKDYWPGTRMLDGVNVSININRFEKEVNPETDPELFL